jgi:hypothetical protein
LSEFGGLITPLARPKVSLEGEFAQNGKNVVAFGEFLFIFACGG